MLRGLYSCQGKFCLYWYSSLLHVLFLQVMYAITITYHCEFNKFARCQCGPLYKSFLAYIQDSCTVYRIDLSTRDFSCTSLFGWIHDKEWLACIGFSCKVMYSVLVLRALYTHLLVLIAKGNSSFLGTRALSHTFTTKLCIASLPYVNVDISL